MERLYLCRVLFLDKAIKVESNIHLTFQLRFGFPPIPDTERNISGLLMGKRLQYVRQLTWSFFLPVVFLQWPWAPRSREVNRRLCVPTSTAPQRPSLWMSPLTWTLAAPSSWRRMSNRTFTAAWTSRCDSARTHTHTVWLLAEKGVIVYTHNWFELEAR